MNLAVKEADKESRRSKEEQRQVKSNAEKKKLKEVVTDTTCDNDESTESDDPSVECKIRKKKADKVTLLIDPKKIVYQAASTSDRLGMSARQTAMTLACVVKAGGGDLDTVSVSKSSVHRQRKRARAEQGQAIMESFKQSASGYVLHYDTKLVNPKGRDTEDRAAVLYSGGGHTQPYLLAIPTFKSSSGKDVETGVLEVLEKYNIPIKDCLATCYDTTASNSGHKSGAHFRLERKIQHAILELECRKHVHELHVTHANKAVFGPTNGPQKSHYKSFKDNWSTLVLDTANMKLFNWEEFSSEQFIIDRAKQSLAWAEWHLTQGTFPRDDYRELNELIVVYLGGNIPGGFKPKRKGAMHDARFMADSIYLLSMELFSTAYHMEPSLANKVSKMAVFISVWHGPYFLKCSQAASAPANDLQYFYDMMQLSDVSDPEFSRIGMFVTESIQRHTSYLKPAQVIFALFDEKLPATDRQDLALALSNIPRPDISSFYFTPGKVPDVPLVCSSKECVGSILCLDESEERFPKKTLSSLVSARSYLLFNLLKIDDLSWLNAPVALWPCVPSYIKARDFTNQLLTVNDGAERGIKLMQELIDRTQDEDDL